MPRSSNILLAATALAAAAGIAYWQLAEPGVEKASTPAESAKSTSASRSNRRPAAPSPYEKLTDPSIRWEVRVDMLRNMKADTLRDSDIDTLYSLLNHRPTAGQEEQWWVTVNEIMEQMRLKPIAPVRYGPEMLAIIRDPAAPDVLRDYAIQHLGQWCAPRGAALGQAYEPDPAIVAGTVQTLATLAMDPTLAHTTIPGVSLIVLADMKSGGVDPAIITPAIDSLHPWFTSTLAAETTPTDNTGKITRISAINAIGMLRLETFRPEIRTLATSETSDPSLRLNSIATLGQIGEASDIPTLKTIAETDTRLHHAATAALTKLTARFP